MFNAIHFIKKTQTQIQGEEMKKNTEFYKDPQSGTVYPMNRGSRHVRN